MEITIWKQDYLDMTHAHKLTLELTIGYIQIGLTI